MILVTGVTGNMGGELVRLLANAGRKVRALTRGENQSALPATWATRFLEAPAAGNADKTVVPVVTEVTPAKPTEAVKGAR